MLARLLNRADFLAAAQARKWASPGLVMQLRPRGDSDPVIRIGFTASKKVGNAVHRNRCRRRLKALAAELLPGPVPPGCDIVVIARASAFDRPFPLLRADFQAALERLAKTP